jgi:hypothetical protein
MQSTTRPPSGSIGHPPAAARAGLSTAQDAVLAFARFRRVPCCPSCAHAVSYVEPLHVGGRGYVRFHCCAKCHLTIREVEPGEPAGGEAPRV